MKEETTTIKLIRQAFWIGWCTARSKYRETRTKRHATETIEKIIMELKQESINIDKKI